MADNDLNFEDSLKRLENIVRILEKGEADLDESVKLFEEGAQLIKKCGSMLDSAEQKVMTVRAGLTGEPELTAFEVKPDEA